MLRRWEDLPPEMQTEAVRKYYDILRKKQGRLLIKRLFDIVVALILLLALAPVFFVFSRRYKTGFARTGFLSSNAGYALR